MMFDKDFDLPTDHQVLILISGPAGSGKTTLCQKMLDTHPQVARVVTATTRAPREGETHGIDYYFYSVEEFEKKIAAGDFYEFAKVHGNYYGTPKQEVQEKFAQGLDLLLCIDVQGVQSFKKFFHEDPFLRNRIVTLFIAPKNIDVIKERMHARGTDDDATIQRRLDTALSEMKFVFDYQYCLISGNRAEDFSRMEAIYVAEKMRLPGQ